MPKKILFPATREDLADLRAGDSVLLSGTVLTARDAAHQRFLALLAAGQPLPVDLQGQAIYYVGPTPAPPGAVIGSCGPTTSGRMDGATPRLLAEGLLGMIGKGQRSPAVVRAMVENGAVYLAATGGAGALIAGCVTACEVVAFADLGSEAVHRLTVKDLPLIVAIDSLGADLYASGPENYRK